VFTMKCTACHGLDTKVIGPPLGNVLEIRSPVYVMNMILNPTEMLDQHPEAKKMLEEYVVPMVPLGVTEEEARAVVEYLRSRQYE
ncbi:MAG: cytochrome c, partial [Bacteroidetes bacterium]|nr:cytochrome c [Bacteroidota bacterium]